MQIDDDAAETPAAFLAELGKALKASEGMDSDLAAIVSQHILTAVPAADCVEQAMMAIAALAATRATPTKENADG